MEEDVKLLLSYIETEVKEGKKPIIGNGVIVNGANILNLINRIRVALPYVTGEDKIIEATEKAKEIIEFAEQQKEKIIDEDIATKEARVKADRIIQQAMLQKTKMEHDVAANLASMLSMVKESVNNATDNLTALNASINKSLDSALQRVNSKLD